MRLMTNLHLQDNYLPTTTTTSTSTSTMPNTNPDLIILHSHKLEQYRVKKTELVRLIIDQLYSLGLPQSVQTLQQESGINFETEQVTLFRQAVLQGNWQEAHTYINHLELSIPKPSISLVTFILREQEYLELLESGEIASALTILRDYLTPLHFNLHRLHELSSYLMYTDQNALRCHAKWSGALGESRAIALNRIQEVIPSSVMVPNHRLEQLLHQALSSQEYHCIYHNVPSFSHCLPRYMSLYDDHSCDPTDHIPTFTSAILNDHTDEVWYLAFSNKGLKLAAAAKNGVTIIWDIRTYQLLHRLEKHDDAVGFVSWSPDDSKLLTCGNDSRFKLWDTETGACLLSISRHDDAVTAGGWLRSGLQFITGSLDKSLIIWDLEGNVVHQWNGNRVYDLQVSQDSRIVVTCANQNIKVHDLTSRSEIMQFDDTESVTSLHLSSDGRYLLTNTANQELHVWDLYPAQTDILSSTNNTKTTSSQPNSSTSTPNRSRLPTRDTAAPSSHTTFMDQDISFMSANAITLPTTIPRNIHLPSLSTSFIEPSNNPVSSMINPRAGIQNNTSSTATNTTTASNIRITQPTTFNGNRPLTSTPFASMFSASNANTTNTTKSSSDIVVAIRPVLVRRYTGHKQGKFVIRSTFGGVNEAFLISGSEDNCAFVWHRSTGDMLAILQGHTSSVNAATWNPIVAGMVATCSDDKTVRIWTPPPA